jgi:pantoate--beta-alanine ligase
MTSNTRPRTRVGIVGAGRAARAVARALLPHAQLQLVAGHARSSAGRRAAAAALGIPVHEDPADVLRAGVDVLLLGVPDDALADVAAELAAVDASPATIVVLSGSVPLDALAPLQAAGHAIARLQPLHPCTNDTTPAELAGSFATIGGSDEAAMLLAARLAEFAGLRPIEVADDALAAWHAAATIASNHVVARLAGARDIATSVGIDADVALEALATLAADAVASAAGRTPEVALTGPVSRGDAATLVRHADALRRSMPTALVSWRRDAIDTLDLARRAGRIDPSAAQRVRRAIVGLGGDESVLVVESVAELRAALVGARDAGLRIGFVPTMGALHEGHAQLVREARAECDVVVVSCFVNPTQFAPGEDLDRYPRTPEADARIVGEAGGDVLWRPTVADVYGPDPSTATSVRVGSLGAVLEGESRPGHFDGVASVVVRLLGAVRPDVLYLGQKDFQQVAVLRRAVADLAVDVELRVVSIVRDVDGLALSSRNAYLSDEQRAAALAIPRALEHARQLVAGGERSTARIRRAVLDLLEREPTLDVDYVELRDPATLAARDVVGAGVVVLVAARVGTTRLIDNDVLDPSGAATAPHRSAGVQHAIGGTS